MEYKCCLSYSGLGVMIALLCSLSLRVHSETTEKELQIVDLVTEEKNGVF